MKKRDLKKVLPFGILFFGISLLLWNCEKEDLKASIVLQELDDKYHSRTIALDDIYDVKKHLDDLMPQSGINKTSEVEGAIFDEDHVLEVIDTLQNTNYSLRFTYPDTPLGEFYNLVVERTPEGALKTPFVLKYTCDENFLEDFIANNFDMYYFTGMVKMHVYTDFFSIDAFSRTTGNCPPELDAVGDPVACEENPIGIGSGGGGNSGIGSGIGSGTGSGTSGSSGGSSGSSSGGTGGLNISLTCTCVGHSVTQINDGTCTCTSYVLEIFMTRSSNRTTDDCPSCTGTNPVGGIGVNQPNISSMINTIKNALDLSPDGLLWLHNVAEDDEIEAINLYITINSLDGSLSNEAKEFGESATVALMNNGEVDFGEEVILDGDFINIECLKSVYDDMGKATKFQEYLKNFEEDFSVADLRFTADDDFSGNEDVDYHNAMAITKPPLANNEIKIKFNTDQTTSGNILNKPDVFKAVAMIHEIIHAEMYRKMLDAVRAAEINQTNLNWTTWTSEQFYNDFLNSLQNKYFGIFDYFTRYNYGIPVGNEPNDWQHEQMAQNYRDVIKEALTDYDPTLTDTQKEALSWIGLNEANIKAWQSLTPDEREAINNLQTQIENTFPNGCE